jgi:hypothetical protein
MEAHDRGRDLFGHRGLRGDRCRSPSRGARRPRARYAATTSPAGRAPLPVVVSDRSRRWPSPTADHGSLVVCNVPRAAFTGRFSGDHQCPVLGDHRGLDREFHVRSKTSRTVFRPTLKTATKASRSAITISEIFPSRCWIVLARRIEAVRRDLEVAIDRRARTGVDRGSASQRLALSAIT